MVYGHFDDENCEYVIDTAGYSIAMDQLSGK